MDKSNLSLVQDDSELLTVSNYFTTRKDELNQRVYNSVLDERTRVIKIITTKRLNTNDTTVVFNELVRLAMHSFNHNIDLLTLGNDQYYGSKATKMENRKYLHLIKYDAEKKELIVEWFNDEAWYHKTIEVKTSRLSKNKSVVKYLEIIKGKKGLAGYLQNHMKESFIKREIMTFQLLVWELRQNLQLLSEREIENYPQIIKTLNKKIQKPFL